MKFRAVLSKDAQKELSKLDRAAQKQIQRYIDEHLEGLIDPRRHGKALTGDWKGLWRYETGNYRIICRIKDDVCEILAVRLGHRKNVYNKK